MMLDGEELTALHLAACYLPRYHAEAQECTNVEAEVPSASTSRRTMEFLIAKGCEVNIINVSNITPLHMACSRGNLAAVDVLIKAPEISLDWSDYDRNTALHEACLADNTKVVEMLLKAMKEKSLSFFLKNNEHQTPLHIACKQGSRDIVKLILEYGFEEHHNLINARDDKDNIPLHLACEGGNRDVVQMLLIAGADVEAKNKEEVTPLHIAARLGHVEIVKILVNEKEEIVKASDAFQQTPLHCAAQYNQLEMIKLFLDQ